MAYLVECWLLGDVKDTRNQNNIKPFLEFKKKFFRKKIIHSSIVNGVVCVTLKFYLIDQE